MPSVENCGSRIPTYKGLGRYFDDGEQLIAAVENAFAVTAQPLRVTTFGLLKAGKSSLLNALTDHLETELFATGAARTTVHNQTLLQQDFIFVDTPGLDATGADDVEAWKGLDIADVLLFVHNPGTGELDRDELDFLAKFSGHADVKQGLEERLVVVLTRLESNEKVIDAIGETVRRQIKDCLGVEPRQFQVSFTSYRKGMLLGKQRLIEYSGIPALRQHIVANLARMRNIAQALRRARVGESRATLLNAVDAALAERENEIARLQNEVDEAYHALAKDSEMLFNTLRSKIAAYNDTY